MNTKTFDEHGNIIVETPDEHYGKAIFLWKRDRKQKWEDIINSSLEELTKRVEDIVEVSCTDVARIHATVGRGIDTTVPGGFVEAAEFHVLRVLFVFDLIDFHSHDRSPIPSSSSSGSS